MNEFDSKVAVAKFLINAVNTSDTEEYYDDDEEDGDRCIITNAFFPHNVAENVITMTHLGPVYMGLWLGDEIQFDDNNIALFPKFLAEAIISTPKYFDIPIEECDIE